MCLELESSNTKVTVERKKAESKKDKNPKSRRVYHKMVLELHFLPVDGKLGVQDFVQKTSDDDRAITLSFKTSGGTVFRPEKVQRHVQPRPPDYLDSRWIPRRYYRGGRSQGSGYQVPWGQDVGNKVRSRSQRIHQDPR